VNPAPHRLGARDLIDLALDAGSWTSWDSPPDRGGAEPAYAAELAEATEAAGWTSR
jgi:acetyl-CoA carboxylase carboxyl transferase subunit beta